VKVLLSLAFIPFHDQELFRKLSAEEVEEFLNGKEEFVNCFQDTVEGFYYLPYDRSYEVSMKDLHYGKLCDACHYLYHAIRKLSKDILVSDTKDMLGSGQFAVVLKGVLTGNDVAIKIPKSCADIIYFKSLLSEIKIMIHIGIHPHIVALMGACTEEIQESEDASFLLRIRC
jgi:serine/threonine protein kinase